MGADPAPLCVRDRPDFVYQHRWRVGDAILWDNRCTQVCALPFADDHHERHMHRTTLEGDLSYYGTTLRSSTEPLA